MSTIPTGASLRKGSISVIREAGRRRVRLVGQVEVGSVEQPCDALILFSRSFAPDLIQLFISPERAHLCTN
jgi:hypothetical protein